MGVHTDPTHAARTSAELRSAGRVLVRGLGVTLVLLGISALPGPIPATVRDAATDGTGGQRLPTFEVLQLEVVAENESELASAAAPETTALPTTPGGATR
jgi:hypothetical protein